MKGSKQPRKYYVIFENEEQMEKAKEAEITIKSSAKKDLTGKKIKLIPTKWTIFNNLSSHIICVKGLTKKVTEDDLKEKFGEFGEILRVELVSLLKGVPMKFPFAYIFFKDQESASKAVENGSVEFEGVSADVQSFEVKSYETIKERQTKLEPQGKAVSMEECPRTLHVGNAGKFATHKEIEDLLSKYGKIDRVLSQIHTAQGKQSSKVFKVVFEDSEGYSNALKAKTLVFGKNKLSKTPIKWNTLPELNSHMVKVNGLPVKVTNELLEEKFKTFGTIANVELFKPKKRSNAVAFIFFESPTAARKSLALDGKAFEGVTLSVHQSRGNNSNNSVFLKKPESGEVTQEAVEEAMSKFGQVKNVFAGLKNFAVTFVRDIDAAKVLNIKNIKINGIIVEVKGHQKENSKKSLGVLVSGLSKDTTIKEVVEHFKECGDVVKNYIGSSKRKSGAKNNFAYLEFSNLEGKTKALKLSKTLLSGKSIFVKNSKPRA